MTVILQLLFDYVAGHYIRVLEIQQPGGPQEILILRLQGGYKEPEIQYDVGFR